MAVIPAIISCLQHEVQFNPPPEKPLLVFDKSANAFFYTKKGTILGSGCTSNLKEISDKIEDLLSQGGGLVHLLSTAGTKARIYASANLDLLNDLFKKYNAKIAGSTWLTFLDYVVWILTFGQKQISCRVNDENCSMLFNHNGQEGFEVFSRDSKLNRLMAKINPTCDFGDCLNKCDYENLKEGSPSQLLHIALPNLAKNRVTNEGALSHLFGFAAYSAKFQSCCKQLINISKNEIDKTNECLQKIAAAWGCHSLVQKNSKSFFDGLENLCKLEADEKGSNVPLKTALDAIPLHKFNLIFRSDLITSYPEVAVAIIKYLKHSHPDSLIQHQAVISKCLCRFQENEKDDATFLLILAQLHKANCKVYENMPDVLSLALKSPQLIFLHDLCTDLLNFMLKHNLDQTHVSAIIKFINHTSSNQIHRNVSNAIYNYLIVNRSPYIFSNAIVAGLINPQLVVKLQLMLETNLNNGKCKALSLYLLMSLAEGYVKLHQDIKDRLFRAIMYNGLQFVQRCDRIGQQIPDGVFMLSFGKKGEKGYQTFSIDRDFLFGYIEYINRNIKELNAFVKNWAKVLILPCVKGVLLLNDLELKTLLEFCNHHTLDFDVVSSNGRTPRIELPFTQLVKYLVQNQKEAEANSNLTTQLCMALSFYSSESQTFEEEGIKLLESINFSVLKSNLFEACTKDDKPYDKLKPIREFIAKNHAYISLRMSDEQLTAYYGPSESESKNEADRLQINDDSGSASATGAAAVKEAQSKMSTYKNLVAHVNKLFLEAKAEAEGQGKNLFNATYLINYINRKVNGIYPSVDPFGGAKELTDELLAWSKTQPKHVLLKQYGEGLLVLHRKGIVRLLRDCGKLILPKKRLVFGRRYWE
jgi:hypothetical protein